MLMSVQTNANFYCKELYWISCGSCPHLTCYTPEVGGVSAKKRSSMLEILFNPLFEKTHIGGTGGAGGRGGTGAKNSSLDMYVECTNTLGWADSLSKIQHWPFYYTWILSRIVFEIDWSDWGQRIWSNSRYCWIKNNFPVDLPGPLKGNICQNHMLCLTWNLKSAWYTLNKKLLN